MKSKFLFALIPLAVAVAGSVYWVHFSDSDELVEVIASPEKPEEQTTHQTDVPSISEKDAYQSDTNSEDSAKDVKPIEKEHDDKLNSDLPNSEKQSGCVVITPEQMQEYETIARDFAQYNSLNTRDLVDQYSQVSNQELEAEFVAGNADAAYMLGINQIALTFKDARSSTPVYEKADSTEGDDINTSNLDEEKLEIGRQWLWKAALNGSSIALVELSNSYTTERFYWRRTSVSTESSEDKLDDESKAKFALLTAHEQAYLQMFFHVNPAFTELVNGLGPSDLEEIINTKSDEQETVFKALIEKWSADRMQLGLPFYFELDIPESVTTAIKAIGKSC